MSNDLTRAWDRLVVKTMTAKSDGAFYGSLLCSLDLQWDKSLERVKLDSNLKLRWNPDWFLSLNEDQRLFVLMHQLTTVANLLFVRQGSRDIETWSKACDYEVNHSLEQDGYNSTGLDFPRESQYRGKAAEEIYQILYEQKPEEQDGSGGAWGDGQPDMQNSPDGGDGDADGSGEGGQSPSTMSAQQATNMMGAVSKALQESALGGVQAGRQAGVSREILDRFLKSQVPWNIYLRKYMTDKLAKRLTWKRPKRRHQDIYLPSRRPHDNGLSDIAIYMDTSGSVTDEMVQILNSEVKHIAEYFKPKNLRVVQFDTQIQHEVNYQRGTKISKMQIAGRGGTCLDCVHTHITENKPKIAIVLSDLYCSPMAPVKGTEVLWIVFGNEDATVPYGRAYHVDV